MDNVKRAQVIMLPTKNNGTIDTYDSGKICLTNKKTDWSWKKGFNELYIVSDDEIKEGNWCYDKLNNNIYQATKIVIHNLKSLEYELYLKKIIASTDTALTIVDKHMFNGYSNNHLPQPSQQFIEKYIESYNKNEVITDVLVDYKTNILYPMIENNNLILKVNPKDNTITIKKLKDNWNLKEIKSILLQFAKDCNKDEDLIRYYNEDYKNLNNWIQKNL